MACGRLNMMLPLPLHMLYVYKYMYTTRLKILYERTRLINQEQFIISSQACVMMIPVHLARHQLV